MLKNNKGITLIALVITIIVLLILAGVSIAMLTGNNGILTRANEAKTANTKAEVVDKVNMSIQAAYAKYVADTEGSVTGTLPIANIVSQYNTDNGSDLASGDANPIKVKLTANGTEYTVTLTQVGNSYTVDEKGVN